MVCGVKKKEINYFMRINKNNHFDEILLLNLTAIQIKWFLTPTILDRKVCAAIY